MSKWFRVWEALQHVPRSTQLQEPRTRGPPMQAHPAREVIAYGVAGPSEVP